MKRLICAIIFVSLLCGCSKTGSQFNLNINSLSTAFHAKIDGNEFEGYMAFDKNLNMILTMTYPDIIKGFSMTFCDDSVISAVDNIDDSHKADEFPKNFAFMSIYKALKTAAVSGGFIKNSDAAYELVCEGVTITADTGGNLTSASLKNGFFIFGL